MSADSLKTVNRRNPSTPQTEKAAPGQKKNAAGGFSFVISDFDRAKRFVILGASEGYYTPATTFAKDNAKAIEKVIAHGQSRELVDYIVEVSTQGRAPKQQPGLFALAIASSQGTTEEKQYALSKLNAVARTGTTLFEFVGYALQFRSWGRALKRAVADWYTSKDVDKLAFQMVKYQSREGWSHADLLRLTHATREDTAFNVLAKWSLGTYAGKYEGAILPKIVWGFEQAKHQEGAALVQTVKDFGLSWEMTPNDKRTKEVWEALLPQMPLGALLRQLPTLTRAGVFKPLSEALSTVQKRFRDAEEVQRARLHPIAILVALKTYMSGGVYSRGANRWKPVTEIGHALNDAFYLAFKNVEPTGKKFLIALDVSGSMWGAGVGDSPLTSAEAVGALSLMYAKTEPETHTVVFAGGSTYRMHFGGNQDMSGIRPTRISPSQRLDDVLRILRKESGDWSSTDCALPMLYALKNKIFTDVFLVMTDNDTWSGSIHPHEALKRYREEVNPEARLIVLATSPSKFSIADPEDRGSLDIAGFDAATPQIVRSFLTEL